FPYAIAYPLDSATFDGSIGDPQGDAWPVTQITSVGETREQASTLRDRLRDGLTGQHLTVDGRTVGPVRLDQAEPIRRDDDVRPPVFYAVDRYRTFNTPM
ncbi:hypothetical protein, partial [Jatrophihabitans sp.]|uniref:hypothetical protein n=1 Tax=Jatrophihabitans sp. TaxID=1932789 RepID=UPI0030C6C2AE|nr:hypothetical protein [Jatrophihabitans sp.]